MLPRGIPAGVFSILGFDRVPIRCGICRGISRDFRRSLVGKLIKRLAGWADGKRYIQIRSIRSLRGAAKLENDKNDKHAAEYEWHDSSPGSCDATGALRLFGIACNDDRHAPISFAAFSCRRRIRKSAIFHRLFRSVFQDCLS